MSRIRCIEGDITKLPIDAIVNAANRSLLGGGGVDGAIHRGAGPELSEARKQLRGCATGEARITPGFRLPARFVIHTVGPVWQGGTAHEAELLTQCYRNSLSLAQEHGLETIALPAIRCGIYGYPIAAAAAIAVHTSKRILAQSNFQPRNGRWGTDDRCVHSDGWRRAGAKPRVIRPVLFARCYSMA